MSKRVCILIGPSGAGKTSFAKDILTANGRGLLTVSADHWFMEAGEYLFNPTELGNAHAACMRAFVEGLQSPAYDVIIVDNTNTTREEISPYLLVAQAFGADVEVFVIGQDALTSEAVQKQYAERNEHGVPLYTIRAQCKRIAGTLKHWPRFWPSYSVWK